MSFHSADRIVVDGVASGIAVGIGIGIGIALLLLPQIMKIISHFRLSLSKLDVACRFRRQQQRQRQQSFPDGFCGCCANLSTAITTPMTK